MPASASANDTVLFSEIKLGGVVSGQPTQFFELFNDTSSPIDLNSWTVDYAKVSANINILDCQNPAWESLDSSSNVRVDELSGVVQPRGRIVFESSLNDNVGGSLRLKEAINNGSEVVIHDLVGWGNESSQSKCFETEQSIIPPNTKSIKRLFNNDGHPVDTNNNKLDFSLSGQEPGPETDPPIDESGGNENNDPDPNPDSETYLPVTVNELLPNPASPLSDDNDEFIEIYNPNPEVVNLNGYKLQTGNNFQYSYLISNKSIEPNSFVILYSSESNLTLSNSGSQARILDPGGAVIHATEAYTNIGEDESWALVDAEWLITDQVTPGEPNLGPTVLFTETGGKGALAPCPVGKYRNPETNRCKTLATTSSLKPCNPDQFRNPETNRCKKKNSDEGLTQCRSDQFRNPETNRCKSISSSSSTLKPCNPDQFRNPETNRCKKIDSPSGLIPCKEGYERNPDTNRCRKILGVNNGGLDSVASAAGNPVSYSALAIVGFGLLSYGVYEYRNEIIKKLKRKS